MTINYQNKQSVVFDTILSLPTVCTRSSDPFYTVTYYINGLLLLGQTVCFENVKVVHDMKQLFCWLHTERRQCFPKESVKFNIS